MLADGIRGPDISALRPRPSHLSQAQEAGIEKKPPGWSDMWRVWARARRPCRSKEESFYSRQMRAMVV